MKVTVSTAVSADGYLDDRSPDRLILSTPEDWAEVHRLRAACDAILVGAETIRRDNPSLLVGDEVLRRERIDRGLSPDPVKVTLTASCRLSPEANFFTRGDQEKIVFTSCSDPGPLRQVATVIPAAEITAALIVTELEKRGLRSLLVEGGAATLRMFFAENLVGMLVVIIVFLIRDAGIVSYHIDSPKKVVIEINFGKDKLLRMKDEEKNEKGKEGQDDEHL